MLLIVWKNKAREKDTKYWGEEIYFEIKRKEKAA